MAYKLVIAGQPDNIEITSMSAGIMADLGSGYEVSSPDSGFTGFNIYGPILPEDILAAIRARPSIASIELI